MKTSAPRKRGKASLIRRAALLLTLLGMAYALLFMALIHHAGMLDTAENSDLIIVLGAGIQPDGSPGPVLTRRSQHGAELWQRGLAPVVLCAGGKAQSHPRSEAAACREILLDSGLPEHVVLMEERSRSTEENAIFSKPIMREGGYEDAILVSDSYHMLRASWLFGRQGMALSASPVPASRIRGRLSYPRSLLREFLAFHWHFVKDALGLPMTHLGGM